MGNEYTITDVVLNSAAQGLEEVIVTVEASRNSEASVLEIQRKSASLLDGISARAFRKIGASDIAGAVKSVPGVSVQGGKYVYVRGLGDRYSKSILNGVDIPGLDLIEIRFKWTSFQPTCSPMFWLSSLQGQIYQLILQAE